MNGFASDGTEVRLDKPGTYSVTVQHEHSVTCRNGRAYSCTIEQPVEVCVVEAGSVVPVKLVSNPSLDKAMKARFSLGTLPQWTYRGSGANRFRLYPMFELRFSCLPESVAFKAVYRDSTGLEIAMPDLNVRERGRTSTPRCPCFTMGGLGLDQGKYKGTLVLRTDEPSAYRDPAVTSIWDGTPEFPIELEVERIK